MESTQGEKIKERLTDIFQELGLALDQPLNRFRLARLISVCQKKPTGYLKTVFEDTTFTRYIYFSFKGTLTPRKLVEAVLKKSYLKNIPEKKERENTEIQPKNSQGDIFLQGYLRQHDVSQQAVEILRINGIVNLHALKNRKAAQYKLQQLRKQDVDILKRLKGL